MKKLIYGTVFLVFLSFFPGMTMAEVNINVGVGFPLPPPIVFAAPPTAIALPGTYVYVVPDVHEDIFFYDGWWWRPWQGRWYRSNHYDRGWGYYDSVPKFYFNVDRGWREFYREHNWHGQRWSYERIPQQRLHQNWQTWKNDQRWEKQGSWGVSNYQPRPQKQREQLRQERKKQYYQRPAVQKHQKQQQRLHAQPKKKFEQKE